MSRQRRRSKHTLAGPFGLEVDIIIDDDLPETADVRHGIRAGMTGFVRTIGRAVRRGANGGFVRRRTGKLADSISESVAQNAQMTVGVVASSSFVGRILETGAAPHAIVARGRRGTNAFLRLRGPLGGTVFLRRVMHPGVTPRYWFTRSVASGLPLAERAFEAELGRVING